MHPFARRVLALFVVVPLLAVLVVVSDHRFAAPPGPARDAPVAMVAMGDSTMSGEGAGDYEAGTDGENGDWCHRSANATINRTVVAGVDKTFNLSCSGANSEQVGLTDKLQNTEQSQSKRLAAIARVNRVAVIVVAVGANDDPRFSDVLNRCVQAWFERKADCTATLSDDWRGRVDRMVPKVERALRDIRTVMHDEGYTERSYTLVLQSYASPVAPGVPGDLQNLAGCPLRTGDMTWVRDTGVGELAKGLNTAARRTNARFLDLTQAGTDHEACTGGPNPDDEWFTRLSVDFDGLRDESRASHALQESFHPNAKGHEQFGRCLTDFLSTTTKTATCVADQQGNLKAVSSTNTD
ncbi:GDSL-type esterase/lipase family protein [Umezawaea tangerina]|uniref:GDSL-like lipase/acylhydrolase family protein n=1 Tax=Umezawaea tangerina TaxID=84725 RepID=A0A2T0SVS0_9PSEU|nr:GDSL-type esterase/lipase family protein [Umezawaea tangerina]PRY37490.1 GDSL-like lipase/acylhydrolase family protein [Umezawaea tangerina]